MILRELQPEDSDGVLLLHDEFIREFFDEYITSSPRDHGILTTDSIHGIIDKNGGKIWVMELDGEIIGMVGVVFLEDNTAELVRMRVKRKYRGQSLGKKLLNQTESFCRDNGKQRLVLHTAKRLTIARKMYEAHGFKLFNKQEIDGQFKFTVMSYYKDLNDDG
ncbi:MAG: GNAT family N-acetyltransferase [Candidatus Hodarchaeales archaeon]